MTKYVRNMHFYVGIYYMHAHCPYVTFVSDYFSVGSGLIRVRGRGCTGVGG